VQIYTIPETVPTSKNIQFKPLKSDLEKIILHKTSKKKIRDGKEEKGS
jgi:hypothetical protein